MTSRVSGKLAFNDSFANFKTSIVPQGGPARFALLFRSYFKQHAKTGLVGILFSQEDSARTVSHRRVKKGGKQFQEILLPRGYFPKIYKKALSRTELLKHAEPVIVAIKAALQEERPAVVFLNGFSLTNWTLLEAASRQRIPVIVLHAGIWKKEVALSQRSAFSPQVRKFFSECEKEVVSKSSAQIFLNTFSKNVFANIHATSLKNALVIPLPFELPARLGAFNPSFGNTEELVIGAVGRWDAIKNHAALLRLGARIQRSKSSWSLSVVTRPSPKASKVFLEAYRKRVTLVAPMQPKTLSKWYRSIDILMVPSRFDVSPTVVLEALSHGKPVIISNQTGWVDAFRRHGLERCIMDPNASGESQEKMIRHLQKHWDAFEKKYQRLRESLIKDHDPDIVFPHYSRLIRSVTSSR